MDPVTSSTSKVDYSNQKNQSLIKAPTSAYPSSSSPKPLSETRVKPEVRSRVLDQAHAVVKIVHRQYGFTSKEPCGPACPVDPQEPQAPGGTPVCVETTETDSSSWDSGSKKAKKDEDDDKDSGGAVLAAGITGIVVAGVASSATSALAQDKELERYQGYFSHCADDDLGPDPKLKDIFTKTKDLLDERQEHSSYLCKLRCCCITSGLCCIGGLLEPIWPLVWVTSPFSIGSCCALTCDSCISEASSKIRSKADSILKDIHAYGKSE